MLRDSILIVEQRFLYSESFAAFLINQENSYPWLYTHESTTSLLFIFYLFAFSGITPDPNASLTHWCTFKINPIIVYPLKYIFIIIEMAH